MVSMHSHVSGGDRESLANFSDWGDSMGYPLVGGAPMNKQHLAVMAFQSAETYAGEVAMRARIDGQWQPTTYRAMGDSIRRIARALLAQGCLLYTSRCV